MSLQLEQDAQVPIQTHIDEFSSRFAIMIFIWIVTTIIWITNIDSILEKVIHVIDPCVGECTNLYNPAKWSEIRWLSGALLGFITSMSARLPATLFMISFNWYRKKLPASFSLFDMIYVAPANEHL